MERGALQQCGEARDTNERLGNVYCPKAPKGPKALDKKGSRKISLNKDINGNTWETRRILGPKNENTSNEEKSEESNKKAWERLQGQGRNGREEEESSPLRPKCWRPGKKHSSGERVRRQDGGKEGK